MSDCRLKHPLYTLVTLSQFSLFAGPAFSYVVYIYLVMFKDNILEMRPKDFKDLGEALVQKARSIRDDEGGASLHVRHAHPAKFRRSSPAKR